MKTRYLRYGILTIFLGLLVYVALGYGDRSFEAFCPFGGMESLWGLFTTSQYSCALGPLNLAMLVGLLGLTILSKKSFCGWCCPIGFLGELFGRVGGKLLKKRPIPGRTLNGMLKIFRYLVFGVVLFFTYRTAELVFRGYDPFYIIFSGLGHETYGMISIIVMIVLGIAGLLIPMFFCRYLCPLSATMDPFSRVGLIKLERNEETCTMCEECQIACPHDIPVHELKVVRHRDCTNCMECMDACPVDDTLEMKIKL